jgi:outer membrane protein assembly factor BamB
VNAAVLDLPTEFQAAMQDSLQNAGAQFLSRDALNERFRLGMQAHFEEWSEDPYQALPVGRVMSTAQAVRLLPAVASDDPFLREYQWTAIRGEYGRLQADSVVAPTPEQWSVPGVIEVYGTYSNQADLLRRADSMLVLHTQKGITGISVLDQKVAWSRTPAGNGVTSFSSSANRSFAQFDAAIHKLPSRSTWSQYEIAGVGNGWLCILQKRTVEVVDLMSGATLWTVELPSNANRVFTTDNLVIAGSTTRGEVYCFDGRDGSSVSLADIEKVSRKTLCGAGRWLVYWVAGFAEQPNRLQWLDPITGEQHLEVPLTGMQQFSFLDDKTLIGVSDDQQMLTVDLHNGTTRRIDFSIEEESGDADAANWKAKRVKVAADSLNFYFMSHEEQNRRPLIQPAGRQLSRFDGGLRAVDRQTGELRWVTNDQTELLATTDQPELPLMVFIENTPFQPNQPVTMASQAVFRGIHKLTGTELFRQPIPSRYGLRYTSVSSAKANTLDIGVYGNRIRMQGGEARPQSP